MILAVTYEDGQIFQHFGHTEHFKLYDIREGKVADTAVVDSLGSGHGALAGFLGGYNVDALICGGIGGGAKNALAEAGIELYPGVQGAADEAVAQFLEQKLAYNPNTECSHHSHAEGETCGDHGCGSHEGHSCGHHCGE